MKPIIAIISIFFASIAINSLAQVSVNELRSDITEIRYIKKSRVNLRKGPGLEYEKLELRFAKGKFIYITEEKDGWLKFRITNQNIGWSAWVWKKLTASRTEWPYIKKAEEDRIAAKRIAPKQKTDDLQLLYDSGLLIRITPEFNEAWVDPVIWRAIDYKTKEGIGFFLASYCAKMKGSTAKWVDIKDNYSGKKLAKYSEAWGFKNY